jgi:hypothetical protein
VLSDINGTAAEATAEALRATGAQAVALRADVRLHDRPVDQHRRRSDDELSTRCKTATLPLR